MNDKKESIFASQERKCKIMEITPELARKMLEYNTANRRLRREHVAEIVSTLKSGRYVFDSNAIGFDTRGILSDGQHRLHAIVESGVTVPMVVVFGCNQSIHLDRGARRTVADNMTIANGKSYGPSMVSAINAIYKVRTRHHRSMDENRIAIFYDLLRPEVENPQVAPIFTQTRRAPAYGADYMAAALIMIMSKKYPVDKIVEMDKLYRNGYAENGGALTPSDMLVISQRNDYLAKKDAFTRNVTNWTQAQIERVEVFMSVMMSHLEGKKTKKNTAAVRKFFDDVTGVYFSLIDEEFGVPDLTASGIEKTLEADVGKDAEDGQTALTEKDGQNV